MKICILAPITYYSREFSLSGIIETQIKMLCDEGHEVEVIVANNVKGIEYLEYKDVVFHKIVTNSSNPEETEIEMERIIKSCEFVFIHDVAWVSYYEWIDKILRKIEIKYTGTKFIHHIHSAPGDPSRELCTEHRKARNLSNVFYGYPNESDSKRFARYIGDNVGAVKTIRLTNNFIDEMGGDEDLYHKLDLINPEYVGFYPAHPMPGKNIPAIIKTLRGFKELGMNFKFVFTANNCPKGSGAWKRVEGYKKMAKEYGIEHNLVWLIDYKEWENKVPYDVVQKIWKVTNFFIMPSWSETTSLILLEAMMHRCIIVANQDFPLFEELSGNGAIYHPYGTHLMKQVVDVTKENSIEIAKYVKTFYEQSHNLFVMDRVKKMYNKKNIYNTYYKPFLNGEIKMNRENDSKPKISVIIPTYNIDKSLVELTQETIRTVRDGWDNVEVIQINNHIDDRNHYDIDKLCINQENVGVSKAWNQGLEVANGDYIAIMNSDISLPHNWGEEMLKQAHEKSIVFTWVRGKLEGLGQGKIPDVDFLFPQVHGCCFLAKKEVFEEIGGFDENFFAYGEDADYWCRAVEKGISAYRANVVIDHVMTATSTKAGKEKRINLGEIMKKSNEYFKQKYNADWIGKNPVAIKSIVVSEDNNTDNVDCVNEMVKKIEPKQGSSVHVGKAYHDIPGYDFPVYRRTTQKRVDIICGKVDVVDKNIIDLGCSVGGISLGMANSGAKKVAGVDYDDTSLNVGRSVNNKKVYFEKTDINPEFIRGLPNVDIILWLSQWMWFYKQHGEDAALRALWDVSQKTNVLVFESSANDGMAAIRGKTQSDIKNWLEEFTIFENIEDIGRTDGWYGRNMFVCKNPRLINKSGNQSIINRISHDKIEKTLKKTSKVKDLGHELKVLKRIQGVDGVPFLYEGQSSNDKIVMQYCGRSLNDINNDAQVFINKTIENLRERGVEYDKDIRPANITMLSGKYYLIDYGLAKIDGERDPSHPLG